MKTTLVVVVVMVCAVCGSGSVEQVDLATQRQERVCWENMYKMFNMVASYCTEDNNYSELVTMEALVKRYGDPFKQTLCPKDGRPYLPMHFREAPQCPNGHSFGLSGKSAARDLYKVVRQDAEFSKLHTALNDESIGLRRAVVYRAFALARSDPNGAMNILDQAMKNSDSIVRSMAYSQTIVQTKYATLNGSPANWRTVAVGRGLKDHSILVRSTVLDELVGPSAPELDDECYRALIDLLGDGDLKEQAVAVLKKKSGANFGIDRDQWQKWLQGYQENKRKR